MNYLNYINEIKNSKVVILYPGRFQPMHLGHFWGYQKLKEAFPENEIYLVTSDIVKEKTHPFSFDEKVQIVTTMFPIIDEEHIIENHYPYDIESTLEKLELNPAKVIVIVAIGEKDFESRFEDDPYYIEFDGMLDYTANHHVYKYKLPQLELVIGSETISGKIVRDIFSGDDENRKKLLFKTVYPEWNGKIYNLLNKNINQINEGEITKSKILYHGSNNTDLTILKPFSNKYNDIPPSIFLSSKKSVAKNYGMYIYKCKISYTNALEVDVDGKSFHDMNFETFEKVIDDGYDDGYDCIIFQNIMDSKEPGDIVPLSDVYVLFDSKNVKILNKG